MSRSIASATVLILTLVATVAAHGQAKPAAKPPARVARTATAAEKHAADAMNLSYLVLTSGFLTPQGTAYSPQSQINGVTAVCAPMDDNCQVKRNYTVPCQCKDAQGHPFTKQASCEELWDPISGKGCGNRCQSCYVVCNNGH